MSDYRGGGRGRGYRRKGPRLGASNTEINHDGATVSDVEVRGGGRGRWFRRKGPQERTSNLGIDNDGSTRPDEDRRGARRGWNGSRGRGSKQTNYGRRTERGPRKERNVDGDPDFWVKNGQVTNDDESLSAVADDSSLNKRGSGKPRQNTKRSKYLNPGNEPEEKDLRARLCWQLERGLTECMVCLDRVRPAQPIWDCRNCYQVFHFGCIKKWSRTTTDNDGWRCPGCQIVSTSLPREYRCFCKKVRDPEWNRNEGLVPHSCGEVCQRPLGREDCVHKCVDLCHPGPCPPCTVMMPLSCPCGKQSWTGRCGEQTVCGKECDKLLNCELHHCKQNCHKGECNLCDVELKIECYCGSSFRTEVCSKDPTSSFSCGFPCARALLCGNHSCIRICHAGECPECSMMVDKITHCPCGKTTLTELNTRYNLEPRKSCLDDVPLCGQVCGKVLSCGPPSSPHKCPVLCHSGPCPPCPLNTSVKCRCGNMDQELPCAELTTRADDARCGKRCQKRRSCGKHKCGELCCILIEHECNLQCGRLLSCGLHRCERSCHRGNCHTCHNVSFDELTCHCGASVMYPPIACGTRPPECKEICRRNHSCGHPVTHNCHSEEKCPPCTHLTSKLCYGGHEERKNVACLVEGISCGKPCGKQIDCGKHYCIKPCHAGPCKTSACIQPCKTMRPCGHICGAPCHDGPCPEIPCTTQIKILCDCGNRKANVPCSDGTFSRVSTAILATRMEDTQAGNTINLADLVRRDRKLDCGDDCLLIERNTRLAAALHISNPEVTSKVIPRYSEFMKDWAKKDATFCNMVHSKLSELVKLSKESKQKSRAYSFPCMNRDKRQFVHEYSEHFGCDSESYDSEPKRNVVVTAVRDRCSVPSLTLLECVAKQKRAPAPPPGQVSGAAQKPTFTSLSRVGSDAKIDWFD